MKKLALAAFALAAAASAAGAAVALQSPVAPAPAPATTPPPAAAHVYCAAFGGRKYYVSNVFESDRWGGLELDQEYGAFLRATYGSASIENGSCAPYDTRAEADAARRESAKGMFLVYRVVDVVWTPRPAMAASPSAPPAPPAPQAAPAGATVATPGAGASSGAAQTAAASPAGAAPAATARTNVYCYFHVEARRRYWTSKPVATAASASRDLASEFSTYLTSTTKGTTGHPSKAWCKTGDDPDKLLADWHRDWETYSASGKVFGFLWEPAPDPAAPPPPPAPTAPSV